MWRPSCCVCGGSIVILVGHGGSIVRIVSAVLIRVFHKAHQQNRKLTICRFCAVVDVGDVSVVLDAGR